jgi:hypothetical protein
MIIIILKKVRKNLELNDARFNQLSEKQERFEEQVSNHRINLIRPNSSETNFNASFRSRSWNANRNSNSRQRRSISSRSMQKNSGSKSR